MHIMKPHFNIIQENIETVSLDSKGNIKTYINSIEKEF